MQRGSTSSGTDAKVLPVFTVDLEGRVLAWVVTQPLLLLLLAQIFQECNQLSHAGGNNRTSTTAMPQAAGKAVKRNRAVISPSVSPCPYK